MAEFVLVSISVHTPPAGSALDPYDVLKVTWDAVSSIIKVYRNNLRDETHYDIGVHYYNYVISYGVSSYSNITTYNSGYAISAYSYCQTISLVWFRMVRGNPEYPYMEKQITANSPVCAIGSDVPGGGVVCDISFSGPVQTTNTTSLISPNGSLTAEASSSNGVVKFGLTDFDYDTGGQTSGYFPVLGVGLFTVYAKDANGCSAQVEVSIFYTPTEQEHYRATWTTLGTGEGTPRTERFRIFEREYIGSVVEIEYGDQTPFILYKPKGGDNNDKFYPVHYTKAEFRPFSVENLQYLPLFTQDSKKYRGVYEVNEGAGFVEVWQGYGSPSLYQEDFIIDTPHAVVLEFTDNVKELEEDPFTDSAGNLVSGDMQLIKIISHIMKKTGLSLKIRSGINIFETHHTRASEGYSDPLDQTYVDVACYQAQGDPFTCWKVLECILRPFGARIFQYDNMWIIEEIDKATSSYDYRIFTFEGVYESNGIKSPIIDAKNTTEIDRATMTEKGSFEIIPAYGKITVKSLLNYKGTLSRFEKEDLLSPDVEKYDTSQGIFTTEEGFRNWTLRLNGTTGINFGRVVVESDTNKQSAKLKTGEDITIDTKGESVGAFYFNPDAWSGYLQNAYIESADAPYQYGPGSSIKFKFKYQGVDNGGPFIVLRFLIKLGSDYLQQDGTWSGVAHVYRYYPFPSKDFKNFELTVPTPNTNSTITTTIRIRIYFSSRYFYDFGLPENSNGTVGVNGSSDLRDTPTTTKEDYRVTVRDEYIRNSVSKSRTLFYELSFGEAEHTPPEIVTPTDYNPVTNTVFWRLLQTVNDGDDLAQGGRDAVLDNRFLINDVSIDSLINGQSPPSSESTALVVSDFLTENLPVELYHYDLPTIVNAKNMYNNYFKLADGTPTAKWSREGVSEELPLQQILLKVIGANYSAPTFKIRSSFMNEFARIGMDNYIRITRDGAELSMTNTEFTSNLNGWTGSASGEAFAWSASNSGSAAVTLAGLVSSEKRYQAVADHGGGYIQITVNIHITPSPVNDREDIMWLLFYKDGAVVHTEKLLTFRAPQAEDDIDFTYKAHLLKDVDAIGFYISTIEGIETCTYQVGKFKPEGVDIPEIYQISDYQFDARRREGEFELMQMSKSYISLVGVDSGGTGQSENNNGSSFSGDFNNDFGTDFDTILN
jgi:hypothetical protein